MSFIIEVFFMKKEEQSLESEKKYDENDLEKEFKKCFLYVSLLGIILVLSLFAGCSLFFGD